MQNKEERKKYMKEYWNKKKEYWRKYKTQWQKLERAKKKLKRELTTDEVARILKKPVGKYNYQLVDGNEILSNTAGRLNSATVPGFTIKKGHCKKCDILFKFGGKGDGIKCQMCLDKEKNDNKGYYKICSTVEDV